MMQQPDKISSRKKFLLWSSVVLASLTAFKVFAGFNNRTSPRDKKNSATVKMLAQDGKLVEVDTEKLFCGKRKKITNKQLKNWIKKNNTEKNDGLK
jgi:hypothetical protein